MPTGASSSECLMKGNTMKKYELIKSKEQQ